MLGAIGLKRMKDFKPFKNMKFLKTSRDIKFVYLLSHLIDFFSIFVTINQICTILMDDYHAENICY